ncbi:MAG: GTP pyrophosphokinase family protein [Lachnobacterium sp.]|jgi:putative GTP pyrophosphokinase|uniref:Putative GTP pyrophosphokinase n=1 Tax=Lachnobacterium bovis DSM 14045 TaxID=1122142 RepID=A0A1H3KW05_9FIRM|nr:GTP pyrophosphokinase family protein [Lachnobacterium bovis]MBQ1801381.1 GTP pyrophosphokinase family protein [Lachnobacterium sp.]SDY56260.1 putative GTP pyrophosphokinase [Lachnobacterium bovis DSM 14045]
METPYTFKEDVDSWKTVILLYNSALKEVGTKLEILNDEFQHVHQYNPIENIKSRIKTPESIVKKLKRYGYDVTIDNMVNYVNDIAGIRLVCSFTSDIYRLAEMIGKQNDLTVISIKDYIKHPKESGYKSYHMIVTVPIFLSDRVVDTKVEIQIRTMAMDFWASLEHKIYYKFEGNAPEYISRDLRECSGIVSMLDAKMLQLNNAILEAKAKQEELSRKDRIDSKMNGNEINDNRENNNQINGNQIDNKIEEKEVRLAGKKLETANKTRKKAGFEASVGTA